MLLRAAREHAVGGVQHGLDCGVRELVVRLAGRGSEQASAWVAFPVAAVQSDNDDPPIESTHRLDAAEPQVDVASSDR